jgi:hypothetical protein
MPDQNDAATASTNVLPEGDPETESKNVPGKQAILSLVEESETPDDDQSIPYWTSLSPQDIDEVVEVLSSRDEGVDIDRLSAVASQLKELYTIETHKNNSNEVEGYSVNNDWIAVKAGSILILQKQSRPFTPVKIIGQITDVSDYVPFSIRSDTKGFVVLAIGDTKGATIRTLEIASDVVHIDLHHHCEKNTRCTFLGAIIPIFDKRNKGDFRLFLHDILPRAEAIDLLADDLRHTQPQQGISGQYDLREGLPLFHPLRLRRTYPQPNGIIAYIVSTLAQNLGIKGLDSAPELHRALEFVTLQAFSHGKGEVLEKLHGLVIGPPNSGKSYLTRAALILNPIAQEISSSGNKITEAGLVGSVKTGPKRNRSVPGILPHNHEGVVCIQEFHDIHGKKRDAVGAILVRMMEDGQVIDSTSGNTTHLAETAVLLDMNRYSHIHPSGKFDSFSDIDIPINLLARFDYIMEIPRDEARSETIAEEMTSNFQVMGSDGKPSDHDWQEELRFIIAFLKTEYRRVEFPEDIRQMVSDRVRSILDEIPSELSSQVEDMRLRIIRSVFKLAKVTTTANLRSVATKEDVEYALRFVQDKVSFVKGIKVEDLRVTKPDIGDLEKRRRMIEERFKGSRFSVEDVQKYLSEAMDGACDKRTIQRDLRSVEARSLKKPKGAWSLR